jgi:ribosomal protein S18 acetylase RimI-like enzyme
MTERLNLIVEQTANDDWRDHVLQQVRAFNDDHSNWHRDVRSTGGTPLDVFALDESQQILGGLVGETYWGWLAIDYLWIAEAHRHNGLGSLLLLEAETVAIEQRQCKWAKVSTFSFQAPVFYQNLGYEIIGKMDDYPPGEAMYWLKKDLPASK